MRTLTASPEYSALLTRFAPRVIRTERENETYTKILYDLDQRSKTLTPAEKELAELLTLLIEDFEEKQYRLPQQTKPLDVPLPNGSARSQAEGLGGCVRDGKHCVGSLEREAGIEQRAHQTLE